MLKLLNKIHQENKICQMMSPILDITTSKSSSMCFLYFPLDKQKHDSKKVPLIMSKRVKVEGWKTMEDGQWKPFVCNLKNEN